MPSPKTQCSHEADRKRYVGLSLCLCIEVLLALCFMQLSGALDTSVTRPPADVRHRRRTLSVINWTVVGRTALTILLVTRPPAAADVTATRWCEIIVKRYHEVGEIITVSNLVWLSRKDRAMFRMSADNVFFMLVVRQNALAVSDYQKVQKISCSSRLINSNQIAVSSFGQPSSVIIIRLISLIVFDKFLWIRAC